MSLSTEARELLGEINARLEPSKRAAEDAGRMAKQSRQDAEALGADVADLLSAQARISAEFDAVARHVSMPRSSDGKMLTGRDALANAIAQSPEINAFRNAREGDMPDAVNFSVLRNDIHGGTDPTGGALRVPMAAPGIHAGGRPRLTIRDVLPKLAAKSTSVIYLRQTGDTNGAAPQSAELAAKSETEMTFAEVESPVVSIAHFVKASKQILSDVQGLAVYISNTLLHGLGQKEELQLVKGSGVGQNLEGLWTVAPDAPAMPSGDSSVDKIRRAMLAVELAGWQPTAILMSPVDVAAIETEKNPAGTYVTQSQSAETGERGPGVTGRIETLWRLPVVVSTSLAAGEYLVGDFIHGAAIFERENANVKLGYSAADGDFVKNALTMLCEERLALAIFAPAAFVRGTF